MRSVVFVLQGLLLSSCSGAGVSAWTGVSSPWNPHCKSVGAYGRCKKIANNRLLTRIQATVASEDTHTNDDDDVEEKPLISVLSEAWFHRTLEKWGATEIPSAWYHAKGALLSACQLGSSSSGSPSDLIQDLANVQIPRRDGGTVYAYQTTGGSKNRLVFLIHEFYGLSSSICEKADALARDLDCTVIAPDTFRGESSTFIPKCIWLALSTPQDRVNDDLDDIVNWCSSQQQQSSSSSLAAVMGFCYGGGKAIRYTTQCQTQAATVICYGSPTLDVAALQKLEKPVCGVFGALDPQFPPPVLDAFDRALEQANRSRREKQNNDIQVYPGVGHAFWTDMKQVEEQREPQYAAYQQVVNFLRANME